MKEQSQHFKCPDLKDSSGDRLKVLLKEFEKFRTYFNLPPATCSSEAIQDFLVLPQVRRDKIINDIEVTCQVSATLVGENVSPSGLSLSQEVRLLKVALDKFGLRVKDSEIFERFDGGDIIERPASIVDALMSTGLRCC